MQNIRNRLNDLSISQKEYAFKLYILLLIIGLICMTYFIYLQTKPSEDQNITDQSAYSKFAVEYGKKYSP